MALNIPGENLISGMGGIAVVSSLQNARNIANYINADLPSDMRGIDVGLWALRRQFLNEE